MKRRLGSVVLGLMLMAWQARGTEPVIQVAEPPLPADAVLLNKTSPWEYRAVLNGVERPWHQDWTKAVAELNPSSRQVNWPTSWTFFVSCPGAHAGEGRTDDPSAARQVPAAFVINGTHACALVLMADGRGLINVARLTSDVSPGSRAYGFASLDLDRDRDLVVRVASDAPTQWWVNGVPVETRKVAKTPSDRVEHQVEFRLKLASGSHMLAVVVPSGAKAWTLATQAVPVIESLGPPSELQGRCRFEVRDASRFVSVTYDGKEGNRVLLNDKNLPLPHARTRFDRVVGIPVDVMVAGQNELRRSWTVAEAGQLKETAEVGGRMIGLRPASVEIQSGPVVTRADHESFTVACRTTARVPVALRVGDKEVKSEPGLIHVLKMEGLQPGTAYDYRLRLAHAGARADTAKGGTTRTMPEGDALTIGLMGDGRLQTGVWEAKSRAMLAAMPDLVVYAGDLVTSGRFEPYWDVDLFTPGAALLATIPVYGVIGNHEDQSPIYHAMFSASQGGRHWAQEINGVLVIGLDGAVWSKNKASIEWLKNTLSTSQARFVFVVSHYPAWSSSMHGRLREDGKPAEQPGRDARYQIYPLLTKYNATAYLAGHDHCYERSEPPGGVTSITSGGAGSTLYEKTGNPEQNPHSKVFASVYHFCLIKVHGDTATLTVWGLEGKQIDSWTWKARSKASDAESD